MIRFPQDENKCNICGSPEIKLQSHNLLHSKHRIVELHRCISRVFYELRVCVSPTHYRSSVIQYFKLLSDVLKIHDGIIPDGMVFIQDHHNDDSSLPLAAPVAQAQQLHQHDYPSLSQSQVSTVIPL